MNKLYKLLFLLVINFYYVNGQELSGLYVDWKNQANQDLMLDEQIDLSQLIYRDSCSYVGIFGANKYKVKIKFDRIKKESDTHYSILGKSSLRGNVCPFEGVMNLERLELNRINDHLLYLVAIGNYSFKEISNKGGRFYGVFRLYFHFDINTQTMYDDTNTEEYNYSRGFVGYWLDSVSQTMYPCHFGFMRYPSDIGGDFDLGGGEPIINSKYRNHGWESHYTEESGNIGYYWLWDCRDKWWLEE